MKYILKTSPKKPFKTIIDNYYDQFYEVEVLEDNIYYRDLKLPDSNWCSMQYITWNTDDYYFDILTRDEYFLECL